jgi:CheY-like chemotaxis protein
LAELIEAADRDLYKNKFVKKHPDMTPAELYEYSLSEEAAPSLRFPPEKGMGGSATRPSHPPRVLVVEDDEAVRNLLQRVLERSGMQVVAAGDGARAIEELQKSHYTAILLDLMMPRVNGFEVIEYLRLEQPSVLPSIVVLTAGGDHLLERLDLTKIHSLIRKPFDIHFIIDVVNNVVKTRRKGRGGEPSNPVEKIGPA